MAKNARKGFVYNDARHTYLMDGERMTGVTTILNAVGDKSALMQWYANQAAASAIINAGHEDYSLDEVVAFGEAVKKYKKLDSRAVKELDDKFPIFAHARVAANRVRDGAADSGTEAHLICELFERGELNTHGEFTKEGWRRAEIYMKWYEENVEKTWFVERPLFSRSMFLGGTPDGGFQMKGGRNLINDKKFKDSLYDPSPFWQMAAYRVMLEEMALDEETPVRLEWKDGTVEEYPSPKEYLGTFGAVKWDGAVVVRVGEHDFEEMHADMFQQDKRGFMAALEIYRQFGDYKNNVKNLTQ